MKQLSNYIAEKLILNKDTFKQDPEMINDQMVEKFEDLFSEKFNIPKVIAGAWYKYYYSIKPEKFFGVDGSGWCCTPLELLYMLAAMLIDDELSYTYYNKIMLSSYPGDNNPYDYSWFEEEHDPYVLAEVVKWISKHEDRFGLIYYTIKKNIGLTNPERVFAAFLDISDEM